MFINKISHSINPDHLVNKLISKVVKIQRKHYEKDLYEKKNTKLMKPEILVTAEDFMEKNFAIKETIFQYIEDQWIEEFQKSFHYTENEEEYISKSMKKMMRDKSSFWFDQTAYNEIKKDFSVVRSNWENRECSTKINCSDSPAKSERETRKISIS